MSRLTLTVLLLAVGPLSAADPPTPTKEELADIRYQAKQLSVYVYSPPELKKACAALAGYGPKAAAAVPALVALIENPDQKDASVRAAAFAALTDVGGTDAAKAFAVLAKHKDPAVATFAALGSVEHTAGEEKDKLMRALADGLRGVKADRLPDFVRAATKRARRVWAGEPSADSVRAAMALLAPPSERQFLTRWDSPDQRLLAFELIGLPVSGTDELRVRIESILANRVASALTEPVYVLTTKYNVPSSQAFVPIIRDATPKELQAQRDAILAAHERRVREIAEEYLARTEIADAAGRDLLAKAFVRGWSISQTNKPAASDVTKLADAMRADPPFGRARAAAALSAVERKDRAKAVQALEAALRDDKSPLVAAVAREVISRLEKK